MVATSGCFQPALPREVDAAEGDTEPLEETEPVEVGEVEVGEVDDGDAMDDLLVIEVDGTGDTDPENDAEPALTAPVGLTASVDRNQDVELLWGAVEGADGYRVVRCRVVGDGCAEDAVLGAVGPEPTRFVDTSAEAQALPLAPLVEATSTLPEEVEVSWSEAVVPELPRYRYRVVAFDERGEGPPAEAIGGRAGRPVIGYELAVDDGAFLSVSGRDWVDEEAPAPLLEVGTVSASLGTYAEFVRVGASPPSVWPGSERSYRVRAVTDYGVGPEGQALGGRLAGGSRLQWERSSGTSADDFAELSGAVALTFDDTTAPPDGAVRWYRLRVEADGAEAVWSEPVIGARQGPPGVPGQVRATTDLANEVQVVWSPVPGALGYHVYRDGQRLTGGQGIVGSSYVDASAPAATASWPAPTIGSATSNQTERVTLTWTPPSRPLGPIVSYTVRAVNAAGEGPESSAAEGRRAGLALVGYEVECTVGGVATTVATGGVGTSWQHATAPAGVISGGTISASQGTHRGFVRLSQAGATTSPGVLVAYRVRGLLEGGAKTPFSGVTSGRRVVGALTTTWQRSTGATATGFAAIPGGVAVVGFDDVAAPSSGEMRWYQAMLIAAGAETRVLGPTEGWRLAFVTVDGAGGEYGNTCALTPQGTYWCWGEIHSLMLGVPSSGDWYHPPAPGVMPAGTVFSQLVGTRDPYTDGYSFNCAFSAPDLWCWGENTFGSLGDGSFAARGAPVRVTGLAAGALSFGVGQGGAHVCAVVANSGRVQCWGNNSHGQLGRTTPQDRSATPVTVATANGSDLTTIIEVKAGARHSCGRRSNGTVACWGENGAGALGGGQPGERVVDTVAGLTGVVELWLGLAHSCARLQGGTVRCWGSGVSGYLGNGLTENRTAPVTVLGVSNAVQLNADCARGADGSVRCWGGAFGATPVLWQGLTGATWVGSAHGGRLRAGDARCVILNGGVRCWDGPSQAPYDLEFQ